MAGGYQTWPLVRFSVIGEAWKLFKQHWIVWSLAMLIVMTGYSVVTAGLFAVFDVGPVHVRGHGGFRQFFSPAGPVQPFFLSSVVTSIFLGGMIRMASNQASRSHSAESKTCSVSATSGLTCSWSRS